MEAVNINGGPPADVAKSQIRARVAQACYLRAGHWASGALTIVGGCSHMMCHEPPRQSCDAPSVRPNAVASAARLREYDLPVRIRSDNGVPSQIKALTQSSHALGSVDAPRHPKPAARSAAWNHSG